MDYSWWMEQILLYKLMQSISVNRWISYVTVIVAAVVAFATIGQWLVNRSKLRLDLYDRRFEIYSKTLAFYQIVSWFNPLKSSDEDRTKYEVLQIDFIRSHRESQFLFSKKSGIYHLLNEFQKKANSIYQYRESRWERGTKDTKRENENEFESNKEWMGNFLPQLEKALKPYLKFQKIAGVW